MDEGAGALSRAADRLARLLEELDAHHHELVATIVRGDRLHRERRDLLREQAQRFRNDRQR